MKSFLIVLCIASILATEVAAREFLCAKNPEVNGRCFWSKGLYTLSNGDAGANLTIAEGDEAILQSPDGLDEMVMHHISSVAYVVGDFLFCPMMRSGRRDDQSYGCIEAFKNIVPVPYDEKFEDRVCGLVDCTKPGFSDFRRNSK